MALPSRFFTFYDALRTSVTEAKEKLQKGEPTEETLDDMLVEMTHSLSRLVATPDAKPKPLVPVKPEQYPTSESKISEPRPFHCSADGCGRLYKTMNTLKTHQRLYHSPSGPRLYACTWPGCVYRSIYKTNTQRHILARHLGYSWSMQMASSEKSPVVIELARKHIKEV